MRTRPDSGRARIALPPLESGIGTPACGQIITPVPVGISAEANAIVGSETITIHARDLQKTDSLGRGSYGYVDKMVHRPSQRYFAVKHIPIHQENTNKAQIQKDLAVGMRSRCPFVVTCYCGLCYELEVLIVMELMDTSLDKLLEKVNAASHSFPESILAYIVHCVVTGLEYLHQELKIIHRDVKPSNILANRQGAVKVCDFGISGDLINSVAQTNLGTKTYLAPERIECSGNQGYRIQSDVWSLGLTVMELATGKPCYPGTNDVFQQLELVVLQEPPRLPSDSQYSDELRTFTSMCLVKDEQKRANYVQLMKTDFLQQVDLESGREELVSFFNTYMGPDP
ncbi:Dual specificity mitogen-activated protein kinase kinase hemipterous [Fasciola hepatica]|uniref:mitogen-activated protein kinase kinase n=1 Tax=Fasciola hepatica TaxID=6192 RepID=A0A2H1C8M1_FASHE|nr:Dual specificity mitogen-activated protein kinase kinase hemipterous [Fasciola hepatica]